MSRDLIDAPVAPAGWTLATDGKSIMRRFVFANFQQAFGWMAACALAAEKMDHHPNWTNVYNRVEVTLMTHSAQGLTPLDLELAAQMDRLATRFQD